MSRTPIIPMRPGFGSAVFVGIMLSASLATMLRVLAVAWLLPTTAFAAYATITATGGFLATIISFGTVEATIKSFPRLVVAQREGEMLARSHRILRRLALRALAAGVPIFALGLWLHLDWLRFSGIAFFVAFTISYTAVLASMQRAAGNSVSLASGTVLRTLGVLAVVVAAATSGDLVLVVLAETGATILTCLASEWLYFRRSDAAISTEPPTDCAEASSWHGGGLQLFLAYSLVSIPFYLDRLYITGVMGSEAAARYAILALFLTAASLLVNTLAQRVGPDAIKLVQRDGNGRAAARQVLVWSAISGSLWIAGIAMVATFVAAGLVPAALARYQIELDMVFPIAVSGLLLNTGLVEFLLIALDRERQFLRAAWLFAATVLVVAVSVALVHGSLLQLMWALAGCRAVYCAALLHALPLHGNTNRSAADGRGSTTAGGDGLFRARFPGG